MNGILYHDTPPDYLTATQAANALGMSRQLFYQSGLADALDRWAFGPSRGVVLYRQQDVFDLARWLVIRRGLIALGLRPANEPLNPESGDFHEATEDGYWDEPCPRCDVLGVADPADDSQVWCPACGIIE
jgi:hypothetical protein